MGLSYCSNKRKFLLLVLLLGSAIFASACASLSEKTAESNTKYTLLLKAQAQDRQLNQYWSSIQNITWYNGVVFDDNTDLTEFKTEYQVLEYDQGRGWIIGQLKSMDYSGKTNLEDLAFPEQGKNMPLIVDREGRVQKAGDYPTNSVFYVPSISLPSGEVSVGDTWPFKAQWVTREDSIPFQIELVGILKKVVSCAQFDSSSKELLQDQCAIMEISGNAGIAPPFNLLTQFDSEIKGEFVFAIEKGVLLYSEVLSQDFVHTPDSIQESRSCLQSQLVGLNEKSRKAIQPQKKYCQRFSLLKD